MPFLHQSSLLFHTKTLRPLIGKTIANINHQHNHHHHHLSSPINECLSRGLATRPTLSASLSPPSTNAKWHEVSSSLVSGFTFKRLFTSSRQPSVGLGAEARRASTTTLKLGDTTNSSLEFVCKRYSSTSPLRIRRKQRSIKVTELPKRFEMTWPKITLFGDSVTRRAVNVDEGCWGAMLYNKVGSYFDVDVRGLEGYNTEWALAEMSKLFPRSYLEKVELFILFFGHNDSWEKGFPPHLPVDQYEANTRAMIKYLADNGLERRKIILITPGWYHHEAFTKLHLEVNLPLTKKEFADCKKYGDTIIRIAKDEGIDVLDFFALSAKFEPLEKAFCDGVHLSREGAKVLYDNLVPIVEKKIKEAYKKPLADLVHAVPFDQRPEFRAVLEPFYAAQQKK